MSSYVHQSEFSRCRRALLWCSDEGRLGLVAPEALVTIPHQVGRLQGVDVVHVSLGNAHGAAVDSEGILWCW
jgi:hypothetical protein